MENRGCGLFFPKRIDWREVGVQKWNKKKTIGGNWLTPNCQTDVIRDEQTIQRESTFFFIKDYKNNLFTTKLCSIDHFRWRKQ